LSKDDATLLYLYALLSILVFGLFLVVWHQLLVKAMYFIVLANE
jgi:hypothetical protein